MVTITDFPIPPSVNNHLIPVMNKVKWRNGKPRAIGRMVKSEKHRDYESACILWSLKYKTGLQKIKAEINQAKLACESRAETFALKLEAYVCINKDRMITRTGKPERVDTGNFEKALSDNLFSILGIDDSHVFPLSIEKCFIDDNSHECVIINLTVTKPRSKSEVMAKFKS